MNTITRAWQLTTPHIARIAVTGALIAAVPFSLSLHLQQFHPDSTLPQLLNTGSLAFAAGMPAALAIIFATNLLNRPGPPTDPCQTPLLRGTLDTRGRRPMLTLAALIFVLAGLAYLTPRPVTDAAIMLAAPFMTGLILLSWSVRAPTNTTKHPSTPAEPEE